MSFSLIFDSILYMFSGKLRWLSGGAFLADFELAKISFPYG